MKEIVHFKRNAHTLKFEKKMFQILDTPNPMDTGHSKHVFQI